MASMSYEESRNRWRVQFVGVDGKRRSISMRGTRSRDKGKSKAAVLCSNVEELIATVKSGTSLDTRLLTWLESVPKQQYKILLESGLVNQRVENELLKIGPYIEHWLAACPDTRFPLDIIDEMVYQVFC